MLWRKRSATDR